MRTTVKAIIINNQNQVLLLNDRNNHYDLPGGAVDEGETLEQALLRELKEETSYEKFEIIDKLPNQYSYYVKNNPDFKSLMHCYVVKLIDETKVSELEANTLEEWVDVSKVLDFFGNKDTPRHQAMKNSIRDFNEWYRLNELGNKIVVIGVSASGKSTFSRKLSKKLNLPLTLMDEIMWKPGWNYIGDKETVQKLDEISSQGKWIVEGYISTDARTFLFERADSIIYLDYHPLVATIRYVKRWWKHRKVPRPELQGSPEKFSFKFLKLVWTKGEAISLNKLLKEIKDQSKIIYLKTPRQTEEFIKTS